ncbi:MAG: nitroreductase family protein [Coriobacteriia bacterium]|nr:nitroreductase family protein [Coriobacteriia bacterium]
MDGEGAGTRRPIYGIPPGEASRWLEVVPVRHARRSYTGEPVASAELDALEDRAASWRPWPGARVVVIREAPAALFVGIVGAYGGISHAPSALAFVGGDGTRGEAVGYTGEGLVLEATARGLDSCWVAGLFSAHVTAGLAGLAPGERVHAVAALGHARGTATVKERLLFGAGRPKHRRSLDEIAPGHERWPAWARAAAEATRVAPSAMNRQPWRFSLADSALTLRFAGADTPRTSKRLDCGIAMLHAELGALGQGVAGTWELRDRPEVAVFRPEQGR